MNSRVEMVPTEGGKPNIYLRTDEGAEVLASPDQQAFLIAAFQVTTTPLVPADSVRFDADAEAFECAKHDELDNLAEDRRASRVPLAEWFARNGLPAPR